MIRPHAKSGERTSGRGKGVSLGRLTAYGWGCSVCFFSGVVNSWAIPMVLSATLFSVPGIIHKNAESQRKAGATVCWGWVGETGNVSGEDSLWLLLSLSCGQAREQRSLVGYSPLGHRVRHDWSGLARTHAPLQGDNGVCGKLWRKCRE